MSALTFRFHAGGLYFPRLGLWLDPREPQRGADRVFISHAHSDHTGAHREVILSEVTSKLMQARMNSDAQEHHLAFGERREFEWVGLRYGLTIWPAGHVFGSAMLLIDAGGQTLLYTGDFKLRAGLSSEPCQPQHADILVMETTYGRPHYRFPPAGEVMQSVVRFCREAIDNEEVPVLLGYSLGKSQELLCGLSEAGLSLMLHPQVLKLTRVYEEFGRCFPPYEKFDPASAQGKVVLYPPSAAGSTLLRQLGKARLAVVTGWAVDPGCRYQQQVDAAFPLSDHADFPELVQMVERVAPQRVYTLHGFAAEFADALRQRGYDAHALGGVEQLALPLAGTYGERAQAGQRGKGDAMVLSEPLAAPASGESFARFAETCSSIGATSKKLEKTRVLASYLKGLPAEALPGVTVWFSGKPFASIQNKVLQLGWALIRDAVCQVSGIDHGEFGQVYLKHSDLGETTYEILLRQAGAHGQMSWSDVHRTFERLHAARGPSGKQPVLAGALRQCTALEGKYLVKILTGELRIGLKEGLVEEAVAQAFDVPLEAVKSANLLLSDVGETAALAKRGQLSGASLVPFRPVKYMLASPEETARDIWARVLEWGVPLAGGGTHQAWVEDKYDGIRAQLHKVSGRVVIFSRDLKEVTATFPEIADAARRLGSDCVVDGEIVAIRGERALAFSELQRRLGRREADLFMGEEVPVKFVAFDLLWLNGSSWLGRPLSERRAALEELDPAKNALQLSRITRAGSAEVIEQAFDEAKERGNEGLMIKDAASVYSPGRRGLAWLKLKKAHATLDCVVVGAEYGHGKRKAVLSDYTFAVRDEVTGHLKTIGKAYSGLTDAEIARLTQHFIGKAVRQLGRYFEVEPDTVLEIAFDAVQLSDRHTSGLALRFPRIVRIRTDKNPTQIDTVASARALVRRE